MKALTLWQPYASLIAVGAKRIETRSWPTKHRGPVAIHAAKTVDYLVGLERIAEVAANFQVEALAALRAAGYRSPEFDLPLGAIVAVADLVDCRRVTAENAPLVPELYFGDYTPGRYMWFLENVRRLPEPVPCRGAQQLWTVPEDVARLVEEAIGG